MIALCLLSLLMSLQTTILVGARRASGFLSLGSFQRRRHQFKTHRRSIPYSSASLSETQSLLLNIPTEEDMEDIGGLLASLVLESRNNEPAMEKEGEDSDLILLDGDLGAGK